MGNNVSIATEILKKGGIIAFPTDTVYGIGCDIFNFQAVRKIFKLKKRESTKPLAAHVGTFEQIEMIANIKNKYFEPLVENFLPGPLAIILPKMDIIDDLVTCGLPTISIRFPDCFEAVELAKGLGAPIAATSANISGFPSAIHHQDVYKYFHSELDYILESGYTKYLKESTIIDITGEVPKVVRVGVIPTEKIESVLKMKVNILSKESQ